MQTVEQIRAEVDAAKAIAMARFARNWGTRDVGQVWDALRQAIPNSASPADAARIARRLLP